MTQRDNIVLVNAENYFNHAYELNEKIIDIVNRFAETDEDEKHVLLDELTIYLRDMIRYANKINVTIFQRTYPEKAIKYAMDKVEEFKHTILYTEKFITGKKFIDSSIYNIETLVEKSNIDRFDYYPYAKNTKDLAYKIGLVLAHPKRQSEFIGPMNKISNGKMSIDEFKKLFGHIRKYLPDVHNNQSKTNNESFVSFSDFKKYSKNDI